MTHDESPVDAAHRVIRPVRFAVVGLVLVALSTLLGVWVFARGNGPFVVDEWWNVALAAMWNPVISGFSVVMGFLGGGWFGIFAVPLGGAAVLVILRRPWSAVYFLAAQAVSAGLVQVLKHTFGRARPEDILILSDFGSYPSGHVAGAATLVTAIIILWPRTAVIVVGAVWVVVMAFSRTFLHAHWLSDTLGGALVGVGTALVVAAAMARPIQREYGAKPFGTAVGARR